MSEPAVALETTSAATQAAPATPQIDMEEFSNLLNLDRGSKKAEKSAETAPAPAKSDVSTKEPEQLAAANGRKPPSEPLDPLDFDPEALKTPEELNAVKERIIKARRQALELTRAAHRSHAAAVKREQKLLAKEQGVGERETRVAAWERVVSTAVDDLESGDGERFLTAVGKLSKSGDPAGFWRNAAIALAKGERLAPKQAAQVEADPELKKRLDMLEQQIQGRQEAEFNQQFETLKTRNLEAAAKNEATPLVSTYASDERSAPAIRERLAEIMLSEAKRIGRPIDISSACEILESELSTHFELSQRANGKTNREKGTTGSEPEAGQVPSRITPKPETTKTVPASLASAPTSASVPMDEKSLRAWQIRQAEELGFL